MAGPRGPMCACAFLSGEVQEEGDVGSAGREAASASGGSSVPRVCETDALFLVPGGLKLSPVHQFFSLSLFFFLFCF